MQFVSVQKGAREDEYPEAETVSVSDYLDTAAILDSCDAVVTVDTSVAHLAGAMAKPTHLLVAAVPDPRWLTTRTDTPWYASMTLHRQERPGTWTTAIASVKRALEDELAHHIPREQP